MLAKIVGTLCQLSAFFASLPHPPPSTMLIYFMVSDKSLAIFPKMHHNSVLPSRNNIVFGGGFVLSKSCLSKMSYEEEIPLRSLLVSVTFQLLLAMIVAKCLSLEPCCFGELIGSPVSCEFPSLRSASSHFRLVFSV